MTGDVRAALASTRLAGRRPAWLEIDGPALAANLHALRRAVGGRPVWAVVKADAYGHGTRLCAPVLEAAGAAGFVVALPEEGVALRTAGIRAPILLSGGLPADGADVLLAHDISLSLSDPAQLILLEEAAQRVGRVAGFHLEIDTGMTRLGLDLAALDEFLRRLGGAPSCRLDAVLSHLAPIAEPGGEVARRQLADLAASLDRVARATGRRPTAHLAASPALCGFADAWLDAVRPGMLLYGIRPAAHLEPPAGLAPVLAWRAAVLLVREVPAGTPVGYEGTFRTTRRSRVAVLCVGYGDGLRREVAGHAWAIWRGQRLPYIGLVNMDLAQVDATEVADLRAGDIVTLVGEDGGAGIRIDDLARLTGRTAYEWVTGLAARLPRLSLDLE